MSYMSISSLAGYLDVSPATALRLVEKGVLPAPVQIGTLKRWDEEQVRRAIAATLDAAANGRASSALDADEATRRYCENVKNRKKATR